MRGPRAWIILVLCLSTVVFCRAAELASQIEGSRAYLPVMGASSVQFATTPPTLNDYQTIASPKLSVEIRRGFNAAMYATNDTHHSEKWKGNFERALEIGQRNHTNNSGFLLGAKFGFSYRISECDRTLQASVSRQLIIDGTFARLEFEREKLRFRVTDADLLRILPIPMSSFVAWKTSTVTSDRDRSVVDDRWWLGI
jgi:hypothetical protein